MPSVQLSLVKLQTVYLLTKAELEAVNGSTPDHDQIIQAMLEDEDHLDEYERYFVADLTIRQSENLFINRQLH